MSALQLVDGLQKPIIRKFKKQKLYPSFIDNIWGADLPDMQLISKFNEGSTFLLCLMNIFSKNPWVIPLKNKSYYIYLSLSKNLR